MTAVIEIGKRRVRLAGANTGEICQRAADLGARRVRWPWGRVWVRMVAGWLEV